MHYKIYERNEIDEKLCCEAFEIYGGMRINQHGDRGLFILFYGIFVA